MDLTAAGSRADMNNYRAATVALFSGFFMLLAVRFIQYAPFVSAPYGDYVYSFLFFTVALFLTPFFAYVAVGGKKVKALFGESGLKPAKRDVKFYILALGVGLLCYVTTVGVSSVYNRLLTFIGLKRFSSAPVYGGIGILILELITSALFPAVFEELFFRGVFFGGARRVLGAGKATVIFAVLFSLAHFSVNMYAHTLMFGFAACWLTYKLKSLYPAIIMHFTNNALSTYFSFAADNGLPFNNFYTAVNEGMTKYPLVTALVWLVAAAGFVASLIFLPRLKESADAAEKRFPSADAARVIIGDESAAIVGTSVETGAAVTVGETCVSPAQAQNAPAEGYAPAKRLLFKATAFDNIFLYAAFVPGILMAVFSIIWRAV